MIIESKEKGKFSLVIPDRKNEYGLFLLKVLQNDTLLSVHSN